MSRWKSGKHFRKRSWSNRSLKGLGGALLLCIIATLLIGALTYTYYIKIGATDNTEVLTSYSYSLDGSTWLPAEDVDLLFEPDLYPGNSETFEIYLRYNGGTPTIDFDAYSSDEDAVTIEVIGWSDQTSRTSWTPAAPLDVTHLGVQACADDFAYAGTYTLTVTMLPSV